MGALVQDWFRRPLSHLHTKPTSASEKSESPGVVPQHAIGRGRYRRAAANRVSTALVAGALTFALVITAATWVVGTYAHSDSAQRPATTRSQTVVVTFAPQMQEAAVISAAQSTCDSFNIDAIATAPGDTSSEEALLAFQALESAVASAEQATGTAFVLEGVPDELVDSYRTTSAPIRQLFTAATNIKTVPTADVVEDRGSSRIVAPVKTTAVDEVATAAQQLATALASLPVTDRAVVLGADSIDASSLTDDELDALIAGGFGSSFQTEKDLRIAASLPDLSKAENGYIDESLLCPVPWAPTYRLLCATVPNLERLNVAFKAEFGHDLAIQSGYRTYADQVWAHENAPEMTTLPGTSNHSWGVAVDFDIDLYTSYENPEVVWLVENGPAYGWRNPTHEAFGTLRPEPWHFEFGTQYPTLPDNGFYGPTPEVEYVFNLPEGWRTKTIYTAD